MNEAQSKSTHRLQRQSLKKCFYLLVENCMGPFLIDTFIFICVYKQCISHTYVCISYMLYMQRQVTTKNKFKKQKYFQNTKKIKAKATKF